MTTENSTKAAPRRLDASEAAALRDGLESAFAQGAEREGKERSAARVRRFWVGASLLAFGFAVIYSALWWLPSIARRFVEERDTYTKTIQEDFRHASETLQSPETLALSTKIQEATKRVSAEADVLTKFAELVRDMERVRVPPLVQAQVEETTKALGILVAKAANDLANAGLLPPPPPASAPPAADAPAAVAPDAIWKAVDEIRNVAVMDADVLASVRLQLNVAYGTYTDPEKKREVARVRDALPKSGSVRPVSIESRTVLNGVVALGTSVDAAAKTAQSLQARLDEVKRYVASVEERAKSLDEQLPTSSRTAINETVASMTKVSASLRDLSANALETFERVASGTDSRIELQDSLVRSAAAPAAMVLLAIGAMFVTFGLTSLLGWLRLVERDQAARVWRERALLDVRIAASLATAGLLPETPEGFLARLHNGLPVDDRKGGGEIGMPASTTVGELVAAIRGK